MEKIENLETHRTKAIPPQTIKVANDPVAELFKNPGQSLVYITAFLNFQAHWGESSLFPFISRILSIPCIQFVKALHFLQKDTQISLKEV